MSLTPDQLQHVARLARIEVGAEELVGVTERLNGVLGLIDQLQALDTRGIEPMSHPLDSTLDLPQRLRLDQPTEKDRREDLQAVAPAAEQGLYLVPKVIE
jgi:aspartyl-tRNA(Asn)/glutamyl-tRNA(Gln) amidotransferase subunit C